MQKTFLLALWCMVLPLFAFCQAAPSVDPKQIALKNVYCNIFEDGLYDYYYSQHVRDSSARRNPILECIPRSVDS